MTSEADADIRRKETAEWFARLNQRKVTAADIKAFSAWRRDPENARAFERMQAMWDAAGTLAQNPDMVALTQDARDRTSSPRRSPQRLDGLLQPLGAVGAAVLLIAVGSWIWLQQQQATYATEIGERRTVRLEDGSRITLDTASRIKVRLGGERRMITLSSGQAFFEVADDPARPFTVVAGDTQVVALGTRFEVRRFVRGARVVLVEGRVAVRDRKEPGRNWSLAPGEQVITSSPKPRVAAADIPAATSWTMGRLTFDDTPVSEAVAEVNRYSRQPIELRDERVSAARVSGVFDAGDVDGFVAALTDLYSLKVERSDHGSIVLSAGS